MKYIFHLYYVQEKEKLNIANKLTLAHIQWKKQPMKVKLAVQTLSASVADAIDYCREVLQLPKFLGSEATTKFIRICDRYLDLNNY